MIAVKRFVFIALAVMSLATLFSPLALADSGKCSKSFFGLPTWYKYLELDSDCNVVTKGVENVPAKVILGLIDIALFLAGLLAVVMIIWGGYLFIFGNGDPGQITNARKTILNAVIGLAIAILASQIVRFVAYLLSK